MESLVNFIIRPPRAEYDPENDLLEEEFILRGKWFQRKDVEIKNCNGVVLQCSHYVPIVTPNEKPLPCVIYCHGNSGCRTDSNEAAILLLPSNITVFGFDFSGSGLSGGEHVTLGWNEKNDLKSVVDHLRKDGNVSMIGLWGRSMGAVTSLMYGVEDPSIAGMILDSPFSDLVDLMMELVDTYKFPLPKFTVKFAIQYMRKIIMRKVNFDITDLNTIKVAKSCFVPLLIGHAIDDDFINPHHSDRIFEAYVGDKNIVKFEGDHNSPRPQFYFNSINIFFHNVLLPPEDEQGAAYITTPLLLLLRDSCNILHGLGYVDDNSFSSVKAEGRATGTRNEINKLHPKRSISQMEVPSQSMKNNSSEEQERVGGTNSTDTCSKMISFDLLNGSFYNPHVPTSVDDDDDDDQYVEFAVVDITYVPATADDAEKMLMRALMDSIHSHENEETSNVTPNVQEECSSTTPESSSKAVLSVPSSLSAAVPETTGSSVTNEAACARHQASSTDLVVDNTRATLIYEKSPANNIMDIILRRWDLNFFRR